eukprot:m.468929 g.468929  ORF g.468929 m.468929 type:complete len:269 (+) comp27956_c0_seq1:142-948(+)
MPSKKARGRQPTGTAAEIRLLKLYDQFAQLLVAAPREESKASGAGPAKVSAKSRPGAGVPRIVGKPAEPKLTGAAAKAAAIALLKKKGGIQKQVDSVAAFKARSSTKKRSAGAGASATNAHDASKRRRVVAAAPAVVTSALPDRSHMMETDSTRSTVFVGGLPETADQDTMHEVFGPFGYIDDVRLVMGKNFGFVNFRDNASAEMAIERMNGAQIHGSTISVSVARAQSKSAGDVSRTNSDAPAAVVPPVAHPGPGAGGRAAVVYDDF